ncbi:1-phosphofructokinase [Planococcus halotolerans]|uniref:Tagatose-6-phosphate kinase n=1 Tax=Planococcus halotolerans TaxID=2233542 RepID=A0A365L0I5_9BACL|nr:1-phosphofructokinase [Planococcus halotolerans]QHJ71299.1 1-phosphofructokinase [Planococcus halotolerans]RAZ78940.1 1-phosphofructokinase [Planococcus halotolerans]
MIYTCTVSPSIDYTNYLPDFRTGGLNRSNKVHYYPGGKGINVSRVLKRLGVDSIAYGFAGGFTGQFIQDFLAAEGVRTDFIDTGQISRINVKIKAAEETELNGPGPELSASHLQELKEKVERIKPGDWFVLSGSIPDSLPISYFKSLGNIMQKQEIRFVLDTSGKALKELIDSRPFLIKPNMEELGELFQTTIKDKHHAAECAFQLTAKGVANVIVSMGADGAMLVDREAAYFAEAPTGKMVNTVGAGDSLVSGFIAALSYGSSKEEAFRYGIASGSATAFSDDLCRKEDTEKLLDQIKVQPFKRLDVKR